MSSSSRSSWAEFSREAWHGLCATAAGRNARDGLSSWRKSRTRTEALYDEARQASGPHEISSGLAAQRRFPPGRSRRAQQPRVALRDVKRAAAVRRYDPMNAFEKELIENNSPFSSCAHGNGYVDRTICG
jgi:hypothetical protein